MLNKIKEKSHLNLLLVLITTIDTYKTIFISIQINKQNNNKLKKNCHCNQELYHSFLPTSELFFKDATHNVILEQ